VLSLGILSPIESHIIVHKLLVTRVGVEGKVARELHLTNGGAWIRVGGGRRRLEGEVSANAGFSAVHLGEEEGGTIDGSRIRNEGRYPPNESQGFKKSQSGVEWRVRVTNRRWRLGAGGLANNAQSSFPP
jgi:hypothetical protein